MVIDPYKTTVGGWYKPDPIINALLRVEVTHPLPAAVTPTGNSLRDVFVVTPSEDFQDIPNFTQFVNIGKDSPKWVMDGRPYMRWNRSTDSYRLVAENDYAFQCMRVAITQLCIEDPMVVSRLGDIPVKTWIRWVTLALAQRFNLDLEHQARVAVICAYYYYTQLDETQDMALSTRIALASRVSRVTAVPAPKIIEIIQSVGALSNGDQFATALRDHSGTLSLAQLKFADLYAVLVNGWIGVNSRENVGVALEHMPTFIAMVYCSLSERSYRKTVITRRAETTGRQNDFHQFTHGLFKHIVGRFENKTI